MADDNDSVTETTVTGWGSRLLGSLVGALIGFAMFLGSFALLYWNEGRAVDAIRALDEGAGMVAEAPPERADPALQGRLVHVSAALSAGGAVRDPTFRVGGDGLARLHRKVEMYQWKEHSETATHKNLGGSETKETTYTYEKVWSESAIDSGSFKRRDGHLNPAMPVRSQTFEAPAIKLGGYRLDPKVVAKLGSFTPLALDTGGAVLPRDYRRDGEVLYRGASVEAPAIGDLRITFTAVALQPASVVAAQSGDMLAPFTGRNDRVINLVELGAVPAAAMFKTAKHEEAVLTWILRAVGFAVMLFGLVLTSSPLSTLLGVIPLLEGIAEVGAFVLALLLAVPLTLATIAVAWIVHRPVIGVALLVAGVVATVGLRRILPSRAAKPVPAR